MLALVSSLTLLLSSILCMALKTIAHTSYMDSTSHGSSNVGAYVPGYGLYEMLMLYPESPEYLMKANQKPIVAASAVGLILGLSVSVITIRSLKMKTSLKVNYTIRSQ